MQLGSPNATSGNHCAFNLTIVAFSLSGDQLPFLKRGPIQRPAGNMSLDSTASHLFRQDAVAAVEHEDQPVEDYCAVSRTTGSVVRRNGLAARSTKMPFGDKRGTGRILVELFDGLGLDVCKLLRRGRGSARWKKSTFGSDCAVLTHYQAPARTIDSYSSFCASIDATILNCVRQRTRLCSG